MVANLEGDVRRGAVKSIYLAILTFVILAAAASATTVIEVPTQIAPSFTLRLSVKGLGIASDIYLVPADPIASSHLQKVKHLHSNKFGVLQVNNLPEGDYLLASSPEPPYAWREYVRVEIGSDRKRIDIDVPSLLPPPPLLPVAQVKGRIFDRSGAPIKDAKVVVEMFDQHETPVGVCTTGSDGQFDFDIAPGAYRMKIAAFGFKLILVPIEVVTDSHRPHSLRVVLDLSRGDRADDPYLFDVTAEPR